MPAPAVCLNGSMGILDRSNRRLLIAAILLLGLLALGAGMLYERRQLRKASSTMAPTVSTLLPAHA